MIGSMCACVCLLELVKSDDYMYPAIMFPPPGDFNPNVNILLKGTDMIFTTILDGDKTYEMQGAFNTSLSNECLNSSDLLWIKTSERAEILLEVEEKEQFYHVELTTSQELAKMYMLISSNKSVCRISPAFEETAEIHIRTPNGLRNKVKINGSRTIRSSYKISISTFIQIEIEEPLHHTIVESGNPLVVFCKDSSIFQILPLSNCGNFFRITCTSTHSDFTVSKCNVDIYTTSFESQVIEINGMKYNVFDSWTIPLSISEEVTVLSKLDVCVLLTEYYYDSSSNKILKSKMLSSLPTSSSIRPYDSTSPVFDLTKNKNAMNSNTGRAERTRLFYHTDTKSRATVPKKKPSVLSSMFENTHETATHDGSTITGSSWGINHCICTCAKFSKARPFYNMTVQSTLIEDLNTELKVNKSQLSSATRLKSCALDNRPSSQRIGYLGAVAILSTITVIASVDIINFYQNRCNKRGQREGAMYLHQHI